MPRINQVYIKKKKAIRDDYERLFKQAKKRSDIIRELQIKYFMSERGVYNILEVKTLRRERKLSHYKKVES